MIATGIIMVFIIFLSIVVAAAIQSDKENK